jgi:hypothetical protein
MSIENKIDVKKYLDNLEQASGGKKTFKKTTRHNLKDEGKYIVRILPNKKDPEEAAFIRSFTHFGFTHPNWEKQAPLPCAGKECPLCAFYKEKEAAGDSSAWKLKSSVGYTFYAMLGENFGILNANNALFEAIKAQEIEYIKTHGASLFDPKHGSNIRITKTVVMQGKKKTVSYAIDVLGKSEVAPEALRELELARGLDELQTKYTVEELKMVLEGKPIPRFERKAAEDVESVEASEEAPKALAAPQAVKPTTSKAFLEKLKKLED